MLRNLEDSDVYFILSWNLLGNTIWPNATSASLVLIVPINVGLYSDHLSTQWYFYLEKLVKPDCSRLSTTVHGFYDKYPGY